MGRARLSISGFCLRNNEKDETNVIARSESDEAILTVHTSGLLRGVYPERDSLVALLTQNYEKRSARNDTRNPDFEVDRSFRGRTHA